MTNGGMGIYIRFVQISRCNLEILYVKFIYIFTYYFTAFRLGSDRPPGRLARAFKCHLAFTDE